jgi:hypothetical protein
MEADMPDTMVDPKVINAAVELACRAPSLHNSQPWRWVSDSAGLHLFADPTRKVQVADPSGREALISCGAVLDHLRVAMAAAGWSAHVDRFPNPNNLKHVASIDFRRMDFVTDGQRERADAILRRRTDRLPLAEPTNWTAFEYALRNMMCDALASYGRNWLRPPGSVQFCGSMTRPTTLNWNGGHPISGRRREFPAVRWCRRRRASEWIWNVRFQ